MLKRKAGNWIPAMREASRSAFRQVNEPLFRLAAAAIAGILLADAHPSLPFWTIAAAAGFAGNGMKRLRTLHGVLLAVVTSFGLLHSLNLRDPLREQISRSLAPGGVASAEVTGIVDDAPVPAMDGKSWQFPLRISSLRSRDRQWPASSSKLHVRLADPAEVPRFGDLYQLQGVLKRPDPVRNPGEFDFPHYLMRDGFAGEFLAGESGSHGSGVALLARDRGNPITAAALRARDWIGSTVTRDLQDSPAIAATVRTMVLGSREKTPDEITDAFRASGTMHIFAVSGLHVALFAGILWFVLSRTPLPGGWILGSCLLLMFFYVFVTGLRPSAWRAALMVALVLSAPVWNRSANLFNSLGAAALLLLGWQTQQLFQAGFTLSFGVLLAIALLQNPFSRLAGVCLGRWNAPDPLLPEALWTRRQTTWFWIREKLCQSLGVSAASTLGSMPLMIGYFNLITPVGLIANLFLVTLSLWILVVACLSLLCALPGWSSAVLFWNNANWALASCSIATAKFFASLPLGHVRVDPARLWRGDPCQITVLALSGGGGAVSIDTPAGRHWMIDCGGLRHWNRTVRPHLERLPVNQLQGLFLTHPDSQHTGAHAVLSSLFPPRHRFRSGLEKPDSSGYLPLPHGWEMEAGVHLESLFPPSGWKASLADDRCAVLRLHCRGFRILFMSDSGFSTEKALLDSGIDLHCDVIVMGRHASDFCGLPEFLRATAAAALIFTHDRFPEAERVPAAWISWLQQQDIATFDQSRCGGVTLRIDTAGLQLKGFCDGSSWTLPEPLRR